MNWRPLFPSERRAKAEVYQEFADDFRRLKLVYGAPKEERRDSSRRAWMRLALCDPLVRDGLRDALLDADEHWGRLWFDPPREVAQPCQECEALRWERAAISAARHRWQVCAETAERQLKEAREKRWERATEREA